MSLHGSVSYCDDPRPAQWKRCSNSCWRLSKDNKLLNKPCSMNELQGNDLKEQSQEELRQQLEHLEDR